MTLCGARRAAEKSVPAQCQTRHAPVSDLSRLPWWGCGCGYCFGYGYGYGYGFGFGFGHGCSCSHGSGDKKRGPAMGAPFGLR